VLRVDDPFSDGRSIIAVRGEVEAATISHLRSTLSDLDEGSSIDLDLGDASIRTRAAMWALEAVADEIEQRRIGLRVVGLDPLHPVLAETL
jgi:hypothetical protein